MAESSSSCDARHASPSKGHGLPTFDFSFAFMKTDFADCLLKLRISLPEESPADAASDSEANASHQDEDGQSTQDGDSNSDCAPAPTAARGTAPARKVEMQEVPVSSLVLAAKSSFFLKLFTNGMSETLQRDSVTIHIQHHERAAMLELLSFIYKGTISAACLDSFQATLQLMLMADRFGVEECFSTCVSMLTDTASQVTPPEAAALLDIPTSVQENPLVVHLVEFAKGAVVEHYGPLMANPTADDSSLLRLSLPALQALLQSDDLNVDSEESVFNAVIKWANHNFPDLKQRRDIVTGLAEDVRFPWMSASFLKLVVMAAPEMRSEPARNLLVEALLFMAGKDEESGAALFRQAALRDPRCWCRPRSSYLPPVKSMCFDIPYSYCKSWTPTVSFQMTSNPFCAARRWFTLNAKLEHQKDSNGHGDSGGPRFGLFLRLDKQNTFNGGPAEEVSCLYRFCIRVQSGSGYQIIKTKSSCVFSEPYHGWGSRDLLRKPWADVVNSPELYFPDGAMQFRCDIWVD